MRHVFFGVLLALAGCKTSGDVKETGSGADQALDSSGIKTLEAPPSSPKTGGDDPTPETLRQQLVVAQGEVENLRHQMEQERSALNARLAEMEEEKRKLTEALAAAPQAKAATAESSAAAQKDTVELLWKQVVDGVAQKTDAEALTAAKSILDSYPKSKRVWGATLAAGMLEYRLKNYKEAAIHFNSAIDMTSKRNAGSPLAWYFQGLSFMQLKKKDDAALFLGELQRKYPQSPVARKAHKLKKAPADLFTDVPNWLDFTAQ